MKSRRLSLDFQTISSSYIVLLFTAFLFYLPAGGYGSISRGKYPLFVGLHVLFLLTISIVAVSRRTPFTRLHKTLSLGQWAAAGYLLFTAFSAACSTYSCTFLGNTRKEGLLTIAFYVVTALVLSRTFRFQLWMLHLVGGAVTLFCLLGIMQFTGANPFELYPAGYNYFGADIYYAGKYWSAMGNAGLCGGFLALSAAALFTAVLRKGKVYWWLMLPTGLSVFSLIELKNEAGMLATAVLLLFIFPICIRTKPQLCRALGGSSIILLFVGLSICLSFGAGGCTFYPPPFFFAIAFFCPAAVAAVLWRIRWNPSPLLLRKLLTILILSALAAALMILYCVASLPGFLNEIHHLLHGNWSDQFGSGRLYIWRRVMELVWENWLLGGGPDTLGLRGLHWKPTYHANLGLQVTTHIDAAHNELLNILVNQGLPALLCYLGMVLCAFFQWCRAKDDDMHAIWGAAAMSYFIQSMFGISMYLCAPFYWLSLAVLFGKAEDIV